MFLLVPAYPGCPGSKAVKRSLLLCCCLAHKGHGGQDFLLQLLIIQQTTTNTTVLTTAVMANKNHPLGSLNKKKLWVNWQVFTANVLSVSQPTRGQRNLTKSCIVTHTNRAKVDNKIMFNLYSVKFTQLAHH